jgi:hypothetical protein
MILGCQRSARQGRQQRTPYQPGARQQHLAARRRS